MTSVEKPRSDTPATSGAVPAFFTDPDFDFEFRNALGATAYGVGDPGMWLATAARISDGDRPSWFAVWSERADQLSALGDTAGAAGDTRGARWAYLSASAAYSRALGAVDGLPPDQGDAVMLPTFRSSRRCWDAMIDSSEGQFVRVEIPYSDTTLPGYLLRPDASGAARPTFVLTNGSDGSLSSLWASGAAEALERGWNAFVYDGPGQQSMLFEHAVPFRHDWEAVLTPVVDTLVARVDVDPDRLTAYGVSQAGYWLPRALAFEHRFVAAVADPGVVDVSTAWTGKLPKNMVKMLDDGKRAAFNRDMGYASKVPSLGRQLRFRARPFLRDSWFDVFTEVRRYELGDLGNEIRTPLFICDPEDEQFWPGQSQELAARVRGSVLVRFTAAEGANFHCQPMGRMLTHERMYDWLEQQLA